MKWCIIGAGGIADRRTIPAILIDKSNEIVAVADANESLAKAVGEKYGVKSYIDYKLMLKECECDCVYVATPVFLHYEQAMEVLKYNRHLFIEKPIGKDGAEAKAIVDAYKKAGKQIGIGYMMKYHNLHEKAKRLCKAGAIGDVNSVRLQFTCWYPDIVGAWRQNKALGGGGALMDLGVHCIELIEYVLNEEIIEVKGIINTKTFNYEVEDTAIIVFKTKSGVLGHIDVNFNIPDEASESKFEMYGTKGYIICNGTLAQEEKGVLNYLYSPQGDYEAKQNRVAGKPKKYKGKNGNMYLKQIQAFAKQVNSGKLNYKLANRAVQVQQVVDEVYKQN